MLAAGDYRVNLATISCHNCALRYGLPSYKTQARRRGDAQSALASSSPLRYNLIARGAWTLPQGCLKPSEDGTTGASAAFAWAFRQVLAQHERSTDLLSAACPPFVILPIVATNAWQRRQGQPEMSGAVMQHVSGTTLMTGTVTATPDRLMTLAFHRCQRR